MAERVEFTDVYVDDAIVDHAVEVLRSTRYVKGPVVEQFEEEFADLCGTDHAVGVSNGTAALLLAMKALDLGQGDEVFVPAHTYFATVSPVLEVGAEPVFVDIDPERYTMAPNDLVNAVEAADAPAAIAVTHMHGQPAAMDPILDIAEEYDLAVIEDAAQAHGAEYQNDRVGTFGDVACFSFYPSKNMTVGGDGGMIVTDNDAIDSYVRQLRNHGRDEDGIHQTLGLNYRLNEVNAAVGREQLTHLMDWNQARNDIGQKYTSRLNDIEEVVTSMVADDAFHVYHHYPIQVPDRESFRLALDEQGIDTAVHYENAVHEQPAVESRVKSANNPRAEHLCDRIVSLPMHPRLADEKVDRVCKTIREYYR